MGLDDVDAIHGGFAIVGVSDIAGDQFEVPVLQASGDVHHPAGGEVVEANDFVVMLQQVLAEVGADEAGAAGNKDTLVCDLGMQGRKC